MKKIFPTLLLISLMMVLAACGGGAASGPNQVHMNDTDFVQPTITIKKGQKVTLVDDVATVHVIENGTWDANGNARAQKEPGAPTVDDQINGFASQEIGPFTTSGTYKIYCTVHTGMNLTITVK